MKACSLIKSPSEWPVYLTSMESSMQTHEANGNSNGHQAGVSACAGPPVQNLVTPLHHGDSASVAEGIALWIRYVNKHPVASKYGAVAFVNRLRRTDKGLLEAMEGVSLDLHVCHCVLFELKTPTDSSGAPPA